MVRCMVLWAWLWPGLALLACALLGLVLLCLARLGLARLCLALLGLAPPRIAMLAWPGQAGRARHRGLGWLSSALLGYRLGLAKPGHTRRLADVTCLYRLCLAWRAWPVARGGVAFPWCGQPGPSLTKS